MEADRKGVVPQFAEREAPAKTCPGGVCAHPQLRVAAKVAPQIEREIEAAYHRHARGLFHYAMHLCGRQETAEDVLQETFLRYFQTLKSGDEIRNVRAWLYRVARNCSLTSRKRNEDWDQMPPGLIAEDQLQDPTASYERVELVRQFRLHLTPRESVCVRLRAEGLSYGEIADSLGIRIGTVAALLARAVYKCRKLLIVKER